MQALRTALELLLDSGTAFTCFFLAALAGAYFMTPFAKRIAASVGAIDYPSERRINRAPTPRMGGIAIFTGIILVYIIQIIGGFLSWWPQILESSPHLHLNYPLLFLAFATVFSTGVIDDIHSLSPKKKLAGQLTAAIIAVCSGLVIGVIDNPFAPGYLQLGWLAYPITVVYLVAYMNIINLIDGLDGLAAGISFIASLTMFVLSLWAGRVDAAVLSIAVAGSTLGFLRYNFNPASIFMGDCGSLTLGFTLGAISILSVTRVAGLTTLIVPLVIAAVPIIDTFSAIVRRARAHVSVGQADKGHIHHRLMAEGFNQRQTVLVIYGWTVLLCVGSLIMTQVHTIPRIGIFLVLLIMSVVFSIQLHLFEPVLLHHYDPKTGTDKLVHPGEEGFDEEAEKLGEHRHP